MTDDRERARNESGQFNDRLPPETVLDVFDARDDRARPITASDVVDALDVSRRTALNKLNELVAAGSLDSRRVGARARVFWRPIPSDTETRLKRLSGELGAPITVGNQVFENGDSHPLDGPETSESTESDEHNLSGPERVADPADTADSPEHVERDVNAESGSVRGESSAGPDNDSADTDDAVSAESAPESVVAVFDGLDLPGSGAKLDARRDAVRATVAYLREHGTAKPADFQRDVYPEHPARHTEGENPARAWWKRTVSKGLKQVAERTNAVEPADTSGVWTWTGEGG